MADFDDDRLLAAMRDYLRSVDAVGQAVQAGDDRALLDRAEERTIAGLALRRRLVELGWVAPPSTGRLVERGEG